MRTPRPVRPGRLASVTGLAATSATIARYTDPAPAAAALGRIARYAAWRRQPAGHIPDFAGLAVPSAVALIQTHLSAVPAGGWLEPLEVTALLESFGIPVLRPIIADDAEQAVAAWRWFGAPVAIKTISDTALHKSAAGGVLLNLADETAVRAAAVTLAERFGSGLRGMQVQPMVVPGRELIVGSAPMSCSARWSCSVSAAPIPI